MQVGQRHLRRRHEIQIPVAGNLEEIGFEFRQVAGAQQGGAVDEERRLDLAIPMLARVQIEHEVDQRPREPRAGAAQHRKPRAGDARGPLEVDDAERGAQIPVRLRREVERPRLADTPHLDVVGRARACRHAFVREIGQHEQRLIALVLDGVEPNIQLLDLLRAAPVGLLNRQGVETSPLRLRNLVARRVLQALESLDFRNQTPPHGLERRDVLERFVEIETAPAQTGPDFGDVIANQRRIEHGRFILPSRSVESRRADICYHPAVASIVRKAVFPAAGLGTRFLPATKAQPKEMLPLVDKPIIQYGVEEAVASGIDNIILVTGRGKNAIEDHFDVSVELESYLEARGKRDQLDEIRKISNMINFAYVRQGEPLGLGHAVLVARELIGNEPFAVILADDVIDASPPAMKQLIDVFERVDGPVLAVERVQPDEVSNYGVIDVDPSARLGDGTYRIRDLVEKPPRNEAPSNLAIIGRYVLTPDIFPALAAIKSDRAGEIQLTNGLRELLKSRPIYACEVKGVRHDTGNKLGFLKAVVYFALRRPDLAEKFAEYLTSLNLEAPAAKR